jgi:PAS domain S-box-containing protein
MRMNLPISDIRYPVPAGAVLVSRTDLKGIITYCNKMFCEVSGYGEHEMLGEPHNLIRHPDVPAEFFAGCWERIRAGKPWNGIIKNRRKNGDCYWVEANVTPWIEKGRITGYVSLRYAATDTQISQAEEAYRAIRTGQPLPELDQLMHYENYVVKLQQRIAEKIMELEKYYDGNEEELRISSNIMARITGTGETADPVVRHRITPATRYSGDMILVARTPAEVLHIMLADAVGHGLAAAINVLPLSQVFCGMTRKGFPISRIAEEMNLTVHKFMPTGRFVAAALVSIDFRKRVVKAWNGGIPPLLLFNREGRVMHRWKSRNLPLGITGKQEFAAGTEVYHFEEDCQLFLFSDGLPEAESPAGVPFGNERIEMLLNRIPSGHRFDRLLDELALHLCGRRAHDDVSLAMADIAMDAEQEDISCRLDPAAAVNAGSDWQVAVSLGPEELKYIDVVPMLTQIVAGIRGASAHRSALFLILSELFNNALDHGILQMDSGIKHGSEGYESYLKLREARLAALDRGKIEIEVGKAIIEEKYGIRIRVSDSGNGFDYQPLGTGPDEQIELAQHGRGIALVKSIAHRLQYRGNGNEVIAYYICAGASQS